MTGTEIDIALAAANPFTDRDVAALPLRDAEGELVKRILTSAVSPRPVRALRMAPRRRRFALALVGAAIVATVLTVLPLGNRSGGPAPAFAAPLVRFANASPLVLLKLSGWHVVYADEEPGGYGEMHFVRGPADAQGNPRGAPVGSPRAVSTPQRASDGIESALAGRVASLTWQRGDHTAAGHQTVPTGLGVTVHQFIREGGSRGWVDMSALFVYGGRELDFRATVPNMAMFYAELRALTAVDAATWLRAMPPSVVDAADSGPTVRLMLKGIPLPPGFDAARIRGARLVHDRYQLGAAITGTVACMWIADWNRARATGHQAMVKRAMAAMATAPTWPILHEMARQGAWPQVLISYVHGMRRGTVVEGGVEPLIPAVNSGLGCSQLGIHLGR